MKFSTWVNITNPDKHIRYKWFWEKFYIMLTPKLSLQQEPCWVLKTKRWYSEIIPLRKILWVGHLNTGVLDLHRSPPHEPGVLIHFVLIFWNPPKRAKNANSLSQYPSNTKWEYEPLCQNEWVRRWWQYYRYFVLLIFRTLPNDQQALLKRWLKWDHANYGKI